MLNKKSFRLVLVPALVGGLLAGCSPGKQAQSSGTERYTSATVQGEAEKINLDAVHQAFFETSGRDLQAWMGGFEKRVNEIYQGDDIVSVDAEKKDGMVRVTGFLPKNDEPGFQGADEKLFELKQTGPVDASRGMPYELSGQGGSPHHAGYPPPAYHSYGLLDNPFVQMMIIGSMLNRPYFTPPVHYQVLRDHRQGYRQTPRYRNQMSQNKGFFSKVFNRNKSAAAKSQRGFGGFSGSGERKRSWFGSSGSNDSRWSGRRSSGSGSSWGGRRSSGGWGGRSRSFGRRR